MLFQKRKAEFYWSDSRQLDTGFAKSSKCINPKNLFRRVTKCGGPIIHIPIKITVSRIEPQGILADPSARRRIIPSGPVVLQPRLHIALAAGVGVAVAVRWTRLAGDGAVGIVGQRIDQRATIVHQPPDGAEVVRQVPRDGSRRPDAGK